MKKVALIIGGTGGIGSETAHALRAAGWQVRALNRDPERAARTSWLVGVEWVKGDAMSRADVRHAAEGAQVIVHAANPPGYRNWQGLALPMLESSIAAAKAVGARVVLPGTVYNFGPGSPELVDETAPQNPVTRKGKIRVAMEERLQEAARDGVPVLVVRAGDFFGPHAGNCWFSQGLVKPGRPLTGVVYPGRHDASHAFAYLPDLARTIALLLERAAELSRFEVFHFSGHAFERGVELAHATLRAAGIQGKARSFPWFAMYLLAPFSETLREMLEMRYLWQTSLRLDNGKLVAFLGAEPHTQLDQALKTTLAGLGCLPAPAKITSVAA